MAKCKSKNNNERKAVALRKMANSNSENNTEVKSENNSKDSIITLKEGWSIVYEGIVKLKNFLEGVEGYGELTVEEHMNLYTTIYDMCRQSSPHNYAYELFDLYKKFIEEYLTRTVLPALRTQHDELLMLRELVRRWEIYKVMFRRLLNIFKYLDPSFHLSWPTKKCFRKIVFEKLRDNAMQTVIILVDKERDGEQIDCTLLRNAVHCIVEMEYYYMETPDSYYWKSYYKGKLLKAAADYYSRNVASWSVEYSCPDYMLKVEQCLKHEMEVVAPLYLYPLPNDYLKDRWGRLLSNVKDALLSTEYGINVLQKECSGCHALLKEEKIDDLSRMYRLFCEIPQALELMENSFGEHLDRELTALVKHQDKPLSVQDSQERENISSQEEVQLAFVQKIIELEDKYSEFVKNVFQNNERFDEILYNALWSTCNTGVAGSRSGEELLVTYCHNLLKKGGAKNICHDDIEGNLEKVVKILACASNKFLAAEIYCKKLTLRVLFDTSANDDIERSTVLKLRQHFGQEYLSNLETILIELSRAREDHNKFKAYLDNNPSIQFEIDFSVRVFSRRILPSERLSEINLPLELLKCVEVFQEFYFTHTERRKLTWIYPLGICEIVGWFEANRSTEMIVTTNQAAVLLLFNDSAKLSYSDIKHQLNLPDEDLDAILKSLARGKYKILLKQPNNRKFSVADTFEFNHKFRSKERRIRVPLPEVDEDTKVSQLVHEKNQRVVIDCYIVRIMKHRKVLLQEQLVSECIEQVRTIINPEEEAINESIEKLIKDDYIQRDEEDVQKLIYVP